MEHFSNQAWADLIRGINPPQQKEMELHLANGCLECMVSRNTFTKVQTIALRESKFAPPENTVRMAKLMLAENSRAAQARTEVAKLTFDTYAQPALAGVRSAGAPAARHMVYEADGLAVDLHFDAYHPSQLLNLTGQVLDKRRPSTLIENSEVILWTQKGLPVAETKANAFGEFNLRFVPENNLRLSIRVMQRAHFHISLANFQPDPDSEMTQSEISN